MSSNWSKSRYGSAPIGRGSGRGGDGPSRDRNGYDKYQLSNRRPPSPVGPPPSSSRRDSYSPPLGRSSSPLIRSPSPNHYYDYDYFMRMAQRVHSDFHDDDDRELFIENLINSIKGQEVILSQHKHSSVCIQWLIENTSDSDLIRLMSERINTGSISLDFLMNQSSSSVLQALTEATLKILSRESTLSPNAQRHTKWAIHWIKDLGKFVIYNINTLINDSNGSQVMVTTLEALGGIRVGRNWSRKTMGFGMKTNINTEIEKDVIMKELPPTFKHLLKHFSKVLAIDKTDRELKELILGKGTSLIQYLLFVLRVRYHDLCQIVVKRLVEIIFLDEESSFVITTSSVSAYLVEAVVLVASDHRLNRIWTKHLKGHLKKMWKHDIANFIVQRLVDATQSDQLFTEICNELFPNLDSIFRNNRPGIGVCLSKACQKFPSSQPEFIASLMKSFHCFEPKERQIQLVPLMLFGEPNSKHSYEKNDIWLHGSLMLQYIFGFEDPTKVTKSLLSLEQREIVTIANDKSGSHVIDIFLQSQSVAPKHKSYLINVLRGSFVTLACDRFGSRIIECLLNTVDNKVKNMIMDELSENESHLNSNRNGWYISKKAGLYHYKHRPDEWKEEERNREKRRREFEDIMDDDGDRRMSKSSRYK